MDSNLFKILEYLNGMKHSVAFMGCVNAVRVTKILISHLICVVSEGIVLVQGSQSFFLMDLKYQYTKQMFEGQMKTVFQYNLKLTKELSKKIVGLDFGPQAAVSDFCSRLLIADLPCGAIKGLYHLL